MERDDLPRAISSKAPGEMGHGIRRWDAARWDAARWDAARWDAAH